jgi:hypothetical protein
MTTQVISEVEQKMHEMIEAWKATWGKEEPTPAEVA